MKKTNIAKDTEKLLYSEFEKEKADGIVKLAEEKLSQLCKENDGETKAVKAHTFKVIYPAVSYYKAMQEKGISKEEAYRIMYDAFTNDAKKDYDSMKMMLKIPGAYKLVPLMWKKVTKNMFGFDAGFVFSFYPTDNTEARFDMTKCPYCEIFKKLGCFELTKILCHTDDVKNDDLHPKLLWHRTKTMGNGDELCDFQMKIK